MVDVEMSMAFAFPLEMDGSYWFIRFLF